MKIINLKIGEKMFVLKTDGEYIRIRRPGIKPVSGKLATKTEPIRTLELEEDVYLNMENEKNES